MSFVPSSKQVLCLWWLLSVQGAAFVDSIRPILSPTDRRSLQDAGLIRSERRNRPSKSGRLTPALFVELTDAGWQWADQHLDAEFSTGSPATAPILKCFLSLLKKHLAASQLTVGEFVTAFAQQAEPSAEPEIINAPRDTEAASATSDVLEAIAQKSQQGATRLHLADLRMALAHRSRDSVDDALRQLEADGQIVLYPLDNPQEIRAADSQAAILNAVGQPRHILYLRHATSMAAS